MPTWISDVELDQLLNDFGEANLKEASALCGKDAWNSLSLMLAIASRESDIANIDGDPESIYGHGKGAWQIDIRSWFSFLSVMPGVRSGTWGPVVEGTSAAENGMVPTLQAGLKQALAIIDGNYREALTLSADPAVALKIAVAAYNAGMGGATEGFRSSGNPDRYTTGGNYATDVFQRQPVVEAWIVAHTPKPDPLAPLTPTERALVETYQADEKHPHLHAKALAQLKAKIIIARKAVYRAGVENGWNVDNHLARYRILYHIIPPQ